MPPKPINIINEMGPSEFEDAMEQAERKQSLEVFNPQFRTFESVPSDQGAQTAVNVKYSISDIYRQSI